MEIGIQLLASMLVGWFLGQWLSGGQWWGGMIGALVSFGGTMWLVYKKSVEDFQEIKDAKRAKSESVSNKGKQE